MNIETLAMLLGRIDRLERLVWKLARRRECDQEIESLRMVLDANCRQWGGEESLDHWMELAKQMLVAVTT